ncbi:MAG: hypothetical protein DMF90_20935 [Acidobacteria bacterium]|jgi:hypothetical protein|nr:MAG: hypothetical protein DMF90_20935 [Acidobacteriota bacterium]
MTNKARWLSMFALVATVGAVPACASGGVIYRGDGYGAYDAHGGYRRDVERIAHQNGYHEGREAGEQDARRGRSFSFDRHGDWRHADEGYRREYGDREFYRHEFREGFQAGYTASYNGRVRGDRW